MTVGRIIEKTCSVLWNSLSEQGYLHVTNNAEEWKRIAKEFEQQSDFPHALGALDGKHVVMQAPARSGSIFFNHKKNTVLYCLQFVIHNTNLYWWI